MSMKWGRVLGFCRFHRHGIDMKLLFGSLTCCYLLSQNTRLPMRYGFAPHSVIGQVKQFDECLFVMLAGNLDGARKNIYDMLPILPLKKPFRDPCWVVISFSCSIGDPCDKVKRALARMHVMS